MINAQTSPVASTTEEEVLLAQARHEAQERVAELHVEEGTVKSEKGQNSPHPDDHD